MSSSNERAASALTKETLPLAIGSLFAMNNYDVEYDVNVHGAQIDIVAKSKSDPFASPLYIEATIEYVSTEKYGKDTTKFLLLMRKAPGSTLLCVSSVGFTAFVKERALESGVTAISYEELFSKFEKFSTYIDYILSSEELDKLAESYEEPFFNDQKGLVEATKWLGTWKGYAPQEARWLIVLGEYGTGKTSLTKILQYRWLKAYKADPSLQIPIRIELKSFSRQFDASGLLHQFLDTNRLEHIPISFMTHLIRTGKVILLLDGYDEMAQFMNSRERRACLSALAELAKDGAKGILTSRPNCFSEAEELNVFESLYRTIEQQQYYISRADLAYLQQENSVDQLVKRYVLERFERTLQDLTPDQTQSLVSRSLSQNPSGQKIVLAILQKVFRDEGSGSRQSLSGKPVIIAYLLELVNDIQASSTEFTQDTFTEWQVYKLIIDRLMLRDLQRSTLHPDQRRQFLHKLSINLSHRGSNLATEETFTQIIEEQFAAELRRLPSEDRRTRRAELFEDLRSSATLTRATGPKDDGWVFSHNSLREYLSAERFLGELTARLPAKIGIPITEAMRAFVSSIDAPVVLWLWQVLSEIWPQRISHEGLGGYLTLLWDSSRRLAGGQLEAIHLLTGSQEENHLHINNIVLKDIVFDNSTNQLRIIINGAHASLENVKFNGLDLSKSNFEGLIAENVSFKDCDATGTSFKAAFLSDCNFSDTIVTNADFTHLDRYSRISVLIAGRTESLTGDAAIGYLKYNGAITSDIDDLYVFVHHPKSAIVRKICEKISEQRNSQSLGLTQKGEARADPPFARRLLERIKNLGWVAIDKNDLVSATSEGRSIISQVAKLERVPTQIVELLREN